MTATKRFDVVDDDGVGGGDVLPKKDRDNVMNTYLEIKKIQIRQNKTKIQIIN